MHCWFHDDPGHGTDIQPLVPESLCLLEHLGILQSVREQLMEKNIYTSITFIHVFEIMAQYISLFFLDKKALLVRQTHSYHDEHALRDIKSVSPVVVGNSAVVLPYSEQPAAQHLSRQWRKMWLCLIFPNTEQSIRPQEKPWAAQSLLVWGCISKWWLLQLAVWEVWFPCICSSPHNQS